MAATADIQTNMGWIDMCPHLTGEPDGDFLAKVHIRHDSDCTANSSFDFFRDIPQTLHKVTKDLCNH